MLEFKMSHVVTKSVAGSSCRKKVFHLNRVHNAGGRPNLWHFQFLWSGGEEGRELHRSYFTLDSSDGKKIPPRVRTEKQLKERTK